MRSDSTQPEQEIIQCVYEMLSLSSPSSVSYFILSVESVYVHFSVNYSVESKIEEAVQKQFHLPVIQSVNPVNVQKVREGQGDILVDFFDT